MTRRYIGEYRSKTDLLYRQTISLDSGLLDVEIVDVSAETDNEFPIEQIQWADSCLIVYSITDRESFKYATRALGNLKSLQNGPSAYLIANKADLDHLREVRNRTYKTKNICTRTTNSTVRNCSIQMPGIRLSEVDVGSDFIASSSSSVLNGLM